VFSEDALDYGMAPIAVRGVCRKQDLFFDAEVLLPMRMPEPDEGSAITDHRVGLRPPQPQRDG
jgi:hypothetical protein